MIRRVQVLNYRCLRYADLRLDRFHVLVGPNASGKSTLLDAIAFLADLARDGLERAVERRSTNFRDLVYGRPLVEMGFQLAIEFEVPEELRELLPPGIHGEVFRYEVAIRDDRGGARIHSERGILQAHRKEGPPVQRSLFPDPPRAPSSILVGGGRHRSRTVLSKSDRGSDSFYVETHPKAGKGWVTTIAFGPYRSALGNLPESVNFPVATYVKRTLEQGVRSLRLDTAAVGRASPPQYGFTGLAPDGSNLAWVVARLREDDPAGFQQWLQRLQTVLPDLDGLRVAERSEDRHAYLELSYKSGVEVPSWMASDGTVRLLALTLLAHLPMTEGTGSTVLLERPETGLHAGALKAICDALQSGCRSQVLLTTYSPALLALVAPARVLYFARDAKGTTDIVKGSDHPRLAQPLVKDVQ